MCSEAMLMKRHQGELFHSIIRLLAMAGTITIIYFDFLSFSVHLFQRAACLKRLLHVSETDR